MLHVNRDHDVARLSPISYMPAWHWVHVSYNKAVQKRCSVTIFNWGHHAWPLTSLTGRDPACMHAYDILCNNAPASSQSKRSGVHVLKLSIYHKLTDIKLSISQTNWYIFPNWICTLFAWCILNYELCYYGMRNWRRCLHQSLNLSFISHSGSYLCDLNKNMICLLILSFGSRTNYSSWLL
jgi:hypothetical protein